MRRVATSMLLAVAAVAAIAVGRDSGGDSARAAVTGAAARTTAAGSLRFTARMHAPDMPEQDANDIVFEGVVDSVHRRGRITYAGGQEHLFDGDVAFTKLPFAGLKDKWLRDGGALDEWNGTLNLHQRAMFHADDLLEFLRSASDGVRDAGRDAVRSVPTTHYEGTLDLRKVVEQAPPDEREQLREWLELIAEDVPTTVPFGLWVDGDGVARRIRIDQEDGLTTTIEYYDFGVPVEITAPPADAIISSDEFVRVMEEHTSDSACSGGNEPDAASEEDAEPTVTICLVPAVSSGG